LLWQKRKRAKARRRLPPAPTPTPTARPALALELSPAALLAAEGKAEGVPLKEAATPMLPVLPAAAEETVGVGVAKGEVLPNGGQLPDGLADGDTEGGAARAARTAGHSFSPSTALCAAEPLATTTSAQKPAHLSMNG